MFESGPELDCKHNGEKEYPAFDFWAPNIATSPDYRMRGRPRAQNRADAVPSCSASQGDFAHPTRWNETLP
jgi:hypothetical protein